MTDCLNRDDTKAVNRAIASRRSIRAFLPTPVACEQIEDILRVAARAPSGSNIQPWNVHVLTGQAKQRLSDAVMDVFNDPVRFAEHTTAYQYYPLNWFEPYLSRRRKVGWDLYGLLGITRDEKARMRAQDARNYVFFDAPVALVFTIDARLEQGSWLDYGMFIQSIMIAARGHGLDSCPQAAFNIFHRVIAQTLSLPQDQQLVCCMALGHADPNAIENTLQTERADLSDFVHFVA